MAATAAAISAWQIPLNQAKATRPNAVNSGKRVVKPRRVWTVTSDGTSWTGSSSTDKGREGDQEIAEALAIQDLLQGLEDNNHIKRELIVNENQWVSNNWVLKETHTTAEGEEPPGPVIITHVQPIPHEPAPGETESYLEIQVDGHASPTAQAITMRWVWVPP